MRRVFVSGTGPEVGDRLTLDEATARHVRVLRLERGEEITLVDDAGAAWLGRIVALGRHEVTVDVTAAIEIPDIESPLRVTVAQGLARGARMEEVIRHGCELGVAAFVPVLCTRSTRRSGNVDRWRTIARDAARQSGRSLAPTVAEVVAFDAFVGMSQYSRKLMLDLPGPSATPLPRVLTEIESEFESEIEPVSGSEIESESEFESEIEPASGLSLLVGPEGGLTPEERRCALDAGYLPVSMGPRVLRTETAALAAVAALQAALGDWG